MKDPDPEWRPDLDYGESNEKLDFPPGCNLRPLLPAEQDDAWMQAQREADSESRDWVFTDPARVASDALSHATHISNDRLAQIKLTHDTSARKTYEWTAAGDIEILYGHRQPPLLAFLLRPRFEARRLGRGHGL